jgi:hypothetical protein
MGLVLGGGLELGVGIELRSHFISSIDSTNICS